MITLKIIKAISPACDVKNSNRTNEKQTGHPTREPTFKKIVEKHILSQFINLLNHHMLNIFQDMKPMLINDMS